MIRLFSLLLVLALGFTAGVSHERKQMRAECDSGEGHWTGTICVNSELLQ